MLFEIHDIILHRLWKAARRGYYAVADGMVRSTMIKAEYNNWRKLLSERHSWMKTTEHWYMNHVRSDGGCYAG